jgi:hypothetical protein
VTATYEYHYKDHEPYERLLHTAYMQFDTLPLTLYILLTQDIPVSKLIDMDTIEYCERESDSAPGGGGGGLYWEKVAW